MTARELLRAVAARIDDDHPGDDADKAAALRTLAARWDNEEKRLRDGVATDRYIEQVREKRGALESLRRLDAPLGPDR